MVEIKWMHGTPQYKAQCERRRERALREFETAADLAARNGLMLVRHTEAHYQLSRVKAGMRVWIMNIYPGNRRIYHDPNRRGPFLKLREQWTLLDVVKAAIKAEGRGLDRKDVPTGEEERTNDTRR